MRVPAVTGSARVSSQARSAPVTTVSTTSLTVPPCASRTARWSSSRVATVANRRWRDSSADSGDGGTAAGPGQADGVADPAGRRRRARAPRRRRSGRPGRGAGPRSSSDSDGRPSCEGAGSGTQCSTGSTGGSAVSSSRIWPSATVSVPSTSASCDLSTSAPGRPRPLDQVDLPQRPLPVERAGDQPGDQLAQLGHRARPRQRRAAHVVAEVEVLVVDPGGSGDARRAPAAPAAGSAARGRSGRR